MTSVQNGAPSCLRVPLRSLLEGRKGHGLPQLAGDHICRASRLALFLHAECCSLLALNTFGLSAARAHFLFVIGLLG